MFKDLIGSMKMRGSIWCVLAGLVAGIGLYLWSARSETPESIAVRDCARLELTHYNGERPGGHIPLAAYQAAATRCAQQLHSR